MMMTRKAVKWMAALGVVVLAAQAGAADAPALKTEKERLSYAIGADMGSNFRRLGVDADVDTEVLIKGLKAALAGEKLLMTEEELRSTLTAYQTALRQKQAQAMQALGESNTKEGEAFLAENKKKEGVVTLPSGLQYKILKAGEGKKPTLEDTVEVNYRGTLINGTEFDSSYRTGQPAVFKLSGIIPGWKEALQLMPVGSKWQIVIPPQLAYGDRGAGRDIGPNATLIFEVELLSIK